jgi:hypothetical protein
MRRRRRLIHQSAALVLLSLLSTELAVFTDAQGGKDKDQGKDQSVSPPTPSPAAAALTDSLVAPQPVLTTGGSKIDTPLPTMSASGLSTRVSTFASTYVDVSSSTLTTGGGSIFTEPPTETFVTMQQQQQLSDKTCPGSLDRQIVIDSSAILYYHLEPSDSGANNGILCGRLEVDNNNGGWIGFGWSTNGSMIGGEAIVGLTDARSVLKYNLSSKDVSGVTPMPAARQTLTDTSIRLEGDKAIMTFTKMLVEDGELEIYETGPNAFLHARGSDGQTIGYHAYSGRFVFTKDFVDDIIATDPPTPRPTPGSTTLGTTVFQPVPGSVLSPNPTENFTRPPIPSRTTMPTDAVPRPTDDSQGASTPAAGVVVDCKDPFITKDECKASIYCEWILISGQKNYCDFGPPVPPTLRPSYPPTMKVRYCVLFFSFHFTDFVVMVISQFASIAITFLANN